MSSGDATCRSACQRPGPPLSARPADLARPVPQPSHHQPAGLVHTPVRHGLRQPHSRPGLPRSSRLSPHPARPAHPAGLPLFGPPPSAWPGLPGPVTIRPGSATVRLGLVPVRLGPVPVRLGSRCTSTRLVHMHVHRWRGSAPQAAADVRPAAGRVSGWAVDEGASSMKGCAAGGTANRRRGCQRQVDCQRQAGRSTACGTVNGRRDPRPEAGSSTCRWGPQRAVTAGAGVKGSVGSTT